MQPNSYTCGTCGKVHELTLYVLTHLGDRPQQRCDNCSAVHVIAPAYEHDKQGSLLPDVGVSVTMIKPGEFKTPWLTEPPAREGYYELKFLTGVEADKRWWWSHRDNKFHFEKDSPAAICLTSIAGYRGLTHAQSSYSEGP